MVAQSDLGIRGSPAQHLECRNVDSIVIVIFCRGSLCESPLPMAVWPVSSFGVMILMGVVV
jgi:hypothetical protein